LKGWIFALPQALTGWWLEKNTKLIVYNKGWTWVHSLITIALAKLGIKSIVVLIEKLEKKNNEPV
jgi:hypothetical protein